MELITELYNELVKNETDIRKEISLTDEVIISEENIIFTLKKYNQENELLHHIASNFVYEAAMESFLDTRIKVVEGKIKALENLLINDRKIRN